MRNDTERIQAKRVLDEQVQKIERHERHVFNPAISEFLGMMNQVSELNDLRAKIEFEQMVHGKPQKERKEASQTVDKIGEINQSADKKVAIKRAEATKKPAEICCRKRSTDGARNGLDERR